MPIDPQLRSLKIDIPAQPEALVKLSLMISDENANLQAIGALIGGDMALASAVLETVNSALYGLSGRVRTVQQAITYLGVREIASVTFAKGLRAVFPQAPELEPLWQRASVRAMLMGRIGQVIKVDHWAAHSAGLFEECGKAVLFRHSTGRYRALLRSAENDEELLLLEQQEFGVGHDALGAALCETWGLAAAAVNCVRYHVIVHATRQLPAHTPAQIAGRDICVLSALANALMTDPDKLEEVAHAVASQAELDPEFVLRSAIGVKAHIESVMERREVAGRERRQS
ncbi:MAG: HDOD domain-containing protein [Burkholderiaceae bacterium]